MAPPARLDGIDAARALAVAGVVHLHVRAFRGPRWEGTLPAAASEWLALAARLAVPFFFLASGYFFARKLAGGAKPLPLLRRQSGRLLWLYAVWSSVYVAAAALASGLHHRSVAAASSAIEGRLGWALDRPVTFALQGPQEHLWFLPALALGLATLAAARAAGLGARPVVALGLALYAVALLAGPYSGSPLGLHLAVNPRNGPFGSVLFVALGALVAEREAARDDGNGLAAGRGAAWLLFACGLAALLAEALVLLQLGRVPGAQDALLGLVLAGPGLFLVARTATCPVPRGLVRLGQLTLGVYAAHALVAMPLARLAPRFPGVAGEIALPVLVLALTAVLAVAMARRERLRPLVQ